MSKRLLTVKDTAAILSMTESALRSLMRRDQIPYIKLGKRGIRFDEEDLYKFLDSRKYVPKR